MIDIHHRVDEALDQCGRMIKLWQSLQGHIDSFRFAYTLAGLEFEQAELHLQRHKIHHAFRHLSSSSSSLRKSTRIDAIAIAQ
jgi:alpha-glucuronidase